MNALIMLGIIAVIAIAGVVTYFIHSRTLQTRRELADAERLLRLEHGLFNQACRGLNEIASGRSGNPELTAQVTLDELERDAREINR